jgi:hypothetical protein
MTDFFVGFWDVEGYPVVVRRSPDGELVIQRVEEDGALAPFTFKTLEHNGMRLSREKFIAVFPYAAEHAKKRR